jgi:hypothetical protein
VEAVLQRLDRLTREEGQTMAAQTLELVYSLVEKIELVLDGTHGFFLVLHPVLIVASSTRGKRFNG